MEEHVSEIQSLGRHRKKNTNYCMVRVSTEKGFSFHVSLFGMDSINLHRFSLANSKDKTAI